MMAKPLLLNTQLLLQLICNLCLLFISVSCQQQQQFPTTTTILSSSLSLAAVESHSISPTTITLKKSLMEASSCGANGNTDTICSPKEGEVWKNGTWYPIIWNSMHPAYVSAPTINIYIYFVRNYETILIKTLPDIDVAKGTIHVLVDNSWRLDPSAQTYESIIYIVSSGVNPQDEMYNRNSDFPAPVSNFVEQPDLNPPLVSLTSIGGSAATSFLFSSGTASDTPPSSSLPLADRHANVENSNPDSHNNAMPPWLIATVVPTACAVISICALAFWFIRRSKKRKMVYGEKGHLESSGTLSSSLYPTKGVYFNGNGKDNDKSNTSINHHHLNSSIILSHPDIITLAGTPASVSPSRSYYTAPQYHPSRMNRNNISTTTNNLDKIVDDSSLASQTAPLSASQAAGKPFHADELEKAGSNNNSLPLLSALNRPQSTNSVSNLSSRSEPPPLITSTDAIMIADTFRQRMRRPEWQQQQKVFEEKEEEEKRRQLSEQLMKEELEAEGTLMKKVGKRAQLSPYIYQSQNA